MIHLVISVAIGAIVVFATALVIYARWHYGSLDSLGFPVIKPYFIGGSDPLYYKKINQQQDLENYLQLGPVYGAYEGRLPRIFVADPDMIRLILVKDFDSFYDHTLTNYGEVLVDEMLDFLPVEKWKHVRSQLTPLFTSARIKQMGKIMQELANEYVNDISEKMKEESTDRIKFDMREFMVTYIVDATTKTFLGIEIPDRKDPNNYLVTLLKNIVFEDTEMDFMSSVIDTFPFLNKLFPPMKFKGLDEFTSTMDNIISARRKSGTKIIDFIQVLVEMLDKVETPEYNKLNITKTTIYAQALEFFVAGYDSLATTMTMLTYYLSQNPEIQEILLQEIEELVENSKEGILDRDTLEEAHYLTACLTETLRMCPPFTRLERLCTKNWTYNGITIKKGQSVYIPSWATNRNPDIFPDPEKFDPTRFMPENKKNINNFSMTSFGFGPRNCIGQRLSYEMLKLVAARMVKDFRFEAREDTVPKLVPGWGFVVTRYYPFSVDIVSRNQ